MQRSLKAVVVLAVAGGLSLAAAAADTKDADQKAVDDRVFEASVHVTPRQPRL